MIHSMSGGVIAENGIFTFVKVDVEGTPYWYLSPNSKVKVGDEAVVPFGRSVCRGKVVKVEQCSRQTAPIPMNRVKEAERIFPAEP